MDVGGHFTLSGQRISTLRNVPGHSGNTLKVPGSRPGRPTRRTACSCLWIPTVVTFSILGEIERLGKIFDNAKPSSIHSSRPNRTLEVSQFH